MTFLERLQAHKGGLLRLKTELYWYGGRGYDGSPDRICLILDAAAVTTAAAAAAAATAAEAAAARTTTAAAVRSTAARSRPRTGTAARRTAALLLIDGSPQWVWVDEADIEILVNDQPTN